MDSLARARLKNLFWAVLFAWSSAACVSYIMYFIRHRDWLSLALMVIVFVAIMANEVRRLRRLRRRTDIYGFGPVHVGAPLGGPRNNPRGTPE